MISKERMDFLCQQHQEKYDDVVKSISFLQNRLTKLTKAMQGSDVDANEIGEVLAVIVGTIPFAFDVALLQGNVKAKNVNCIVNQVKNVFT